jgi:hypothetical protein
MLRALGLSSVLVLSILLAGMAKSQPPPPSPSELSQPNQSEAAPAQQQPAGGPANSVAVTPAAQAEPGGHAAPEPAKKPDAHDDKASNERLLMIWTAVLAVLTGALVVVAGVQAALFVVQLRYMNKGLADAEIAAKASRDSALATRDSVDLAKITARRQLRAYLVVEKCVLRYLDQFVVATLKIRNCGQTPADRIMIVGSINPLHRPLGVLIQPVDIASIPKARLGTGHMIEHRIEHEAFEKIDSDGLAAKTHWISVRGDVEYTDIFGTVWVLPFEFVTGGKFGELIREGELQPSPEARQEYEKGTPDPYQPPGILGKG